MIGSQKKTAYTQLKINEIEKEIDKLSWHMAFTTRLCSCKKTFEFESDLMAHIDRHLPPEAKKKQMDLFVNDD